MASGAAAMAEGGPILVFDSGIGGLSVLRAIRAGLPRARVVYVADDAAFPYGAWEEQALSDHIVALMGRLIAAHAPAAVVIACNTASTLVLPPLRERFPLPFVGTVPAIKPAAEQTRSGVVAVLATPGTMKRDYTRALIKSFAQACHVRLVGAPALAGIAEARMRGEPFERDEIAEQIAPCFEEIEGARTDIVALACTHYPFLADIMAEIAPWPVKWLDPAPAIARRLASVLKDRAVAEGQSIARFTSGGRPSDALAALLATFGLSFEAVSAGSGRLPEFDISAQKP
jgi:glutamate racemase